MLGLRGRGHLDHSEHAGGVVEKEGIALRVDDRNAENVSVMVRADRGFGHGFGWVKLASSGLVS